MIAQADYLPCLQCLQDRQDRKQWRMGDVKAKAVTKGTRGCRSKDTGVVCLDTVKPTIDEWEKFDAYVKSMMDSEHCTQNELSGIQLLPLTCHRCVPCLCEP